MTMKTKYGAMSDDKELTELQSFSPDRSSGHDLETRVTECRRCQSGKHFHPFTSLVPPSRWDPTKYQLCDLDSDLRDPTKYHLYDLDPDLSDWSSPTHHKINSQPSTGHPEKSTNERTSGQAEQTWQNQLLFAYLDPLSAADEFSYNGDVLDKAEIAAHEHGQQAQVTGHVAEIAAHGRCDRRRSFNQAAGIAAQTQDDLQSATERLAKLSPLRHSEGPAGLRKVDHLAEIEARTNVDKPQTFCHKAEIAAEKPFDIRTSALEPLVTCETHILYKRPLGHMAETAAYRSYDLTQTSNHRAEIAAVGPCKSS